MSNVLESSNLVTMLTEHGAASNSEIHARVASFKLVAQCSASEDGQEGVVGSGSGRGGRAGGGGYEWECICYELEGEAVSKIIYMIEYEGVSGEIATQIATWTYTPTTMERTFETDYAYAHHFINGYEGSARTTASQLAYPVMRTTFLQFECKGA
jgi:hypothetical protein